MFSRFCLLTCCLALITHCATAQANDGFQRRDGGMYLIRNGESRPMTRDVRLPNGRLITRDGFVVGRDGSRMELKDGQGCSLLGEAVASKPQPDGRILLATASSTKGSRSAPASVNSYQAAVWQWLEGRGKGKGHGKFKRKHKRDDD